MLEIMTIAIYVSDGISHLRNKIPDTGKSLPAHHMIECCLNWKKSSMNSIRPGRMKKELKCYDLILPFQIFRERRSHISDEDTQAD